MLGFLVAISVVSAHGVGIDDLDKGRILFLGDSITQAGEYVSQFEYCLDALYPKKHFDIVSIGLASETVSGLSEAVHPFPRPCLHERLWAALDVVRPKIVFACYGINDAIYHPLSQERFQAFKTGIQKLLAEDRAAGAKTVLLTPLPFDPIAAGNSVRAESAPDFSYMNVYDRYDDVMTEYAKWEMTLAGPDVEVVDVHTPVAMTVAEKRKLDPKFSLSSDGVHVNDTGHWIVARAILAHFGVSETRLPLNGSLDALSKDPLFQIVDQRRQLRSKAWLSYVGYTRGDVFKSWSVEKAEREASELQIQIDRLRSRRSIKTEQDSSPSRQKFQL